MSVMPLLAPVEVQMHECEDCLLEFCSSFNLRRHARLHQRSFNENQKNREQLAAYWDKLSPEKAKDLISFNDAMLLKGLSGSTVVKALASTFCKPGGVLNLPDAYVKAGSTLLDIVQSKPSELKLSSKELFDVLDDASEGTFLCPVMVDFAQTYVFNGDDAGGCLKWNNVISTASLLFERQLMKAWFEDKEAEALRCQNQLVEEEEAAQKRQAALSEKKRQKKLRQKEQKLKEQLKESQNVEADSVDTPALAQESAPPSSSDTKADSPDLCLNLDSISPSLEKGPTENTEHKDEEHSQTDEFKVVGANRHRRRRSAPILRQPIRHQTYRRIGIPANRPQTVPRQKVWVKKLTVVNSGVGSSKPSPSVATKDAHPPRQVEEDKYQLMIGSIAISLKRGVSKQKDEGTAAASKPRDTCKAEHPRPMVAKGNPKKSMKAGSSQVGSKQLKPVSRNETKSSIVPVNRGNKGLGSGQSDGGNLRGKTSPAV